MGHMINKFNEVVPVVNGRVSSDTSTYRNTTTFEEELLEEIKRLELENEELRSKVEELESII
jgi:regulator of replication initiation timing